jgi:hypothetical protein
MVLVLIAPPMGEDYVRVDLRLKRLEPLLYFGAFIGEVPIPKLAKLDFRTLGAIQKSPR